MGISTLQSYRGAQMFEAIGLNQELIDKYFTGTASRIEGVGLEVLAREAQMKHEHAFRPATRIGNRAGRRRRLSVSRARRISPAESADGRASCSTRCARAPRSFRDLPGIRGVDRPAEPRPVHAARADGAARAGARGPARRSGAGHRDRQALRHRRDVVRVDQQRSARNAGHRHEPHRRALEYRRGRRG